jgi:antitoxin (DNA-binding transcriptional repressor) of toxin-antitoxin stability system
MAMITRISVGDFTHKNKDYRDPIKRGGNILVTDRGTPIFMVVPVPEEYKLPIIRKTRKVKDWSLVDTWEKELIDNEMVIELTFSRLRRAYGDTKLHLEDKYKRLTKERMEILIKIKELKRV